MIKRFTLQVVLRILAIVVFCVALSMLLMKGLWFSTLLVGMLIILQVYFLIRYVNNTNYALVKFMDALKNEDFSVYFSPSKKGDSFAKVYDDFNLIIRLFKRNKIEKEAQYKYFNYLLEHVNLGIISIRKEDLDGNNSEDEILFLNQAACTILKQPQHRYWHRLAKNVPWLVAEIKKINDGGKVLVEIGIKYGNRLYNPIVIVWAFLSKPEHFEEDAQHLASHGYAGILDFLSKS